jgi:hypothetical protein
MELTAMQKILWIVIIAAIVFTGYVAARPYLVVEDIKSALRTGAADQLSEHIDFPLLRRNLTARLSAQMQSQSPPEWKSNPLLAAVGQIGSTVVDGAVAALVQPATVAAMLEGRRVVNWRPEARNQASADTQEPLKDARYGYDSPMSFSIRVPTVQGGEIRFILSRSGLDWKVTDLVVP